MTQFPNLLIIDSNIQEMDIVINSIPSNNEYLIVDASLDTEQTILDFINNKQYSAVAYMSHTQQPYEHKIFSDYTFNLTLESDKQRLADFWNNFNTPIVDYLGCFLYSDADWINTFNFIENITGKQVRASNNNTGHLAVGGDWILESDNVNIKDLYFTDNIDVWFQTLEVIYTSVQDGPWNSSSTWDEPGRPDVRDWPNHVVIINHAVTGGPSTDNPGGVINLHMSGFGSSITINNGGSLTIPNKLHVGSGNLFVNSGGFISANKMVLKPTNCELNGIVTTVNNLNLNADFSGSPTITVGGQLKLGANTIDIIFNTLHLNVSGNMIVQNTTFKYDTGFINVGGNFNLLGGQNMFIPEGSILDISGDLHIENGLKILGYNPNTGDTGHGEGGIVRWAGTLVKFNGPFGGRDGIGNDEFGNEALNNCPRTPIPYSSPWNLATCSVATATEVANAEVAEHGEVPEPEPESTQNLIGAVSDPISNNAKFTNLPLGGLVGFSFYNFVNDNGKESYRSLDYIKSEYIFDFIKSQSFTCVKFPLTIWYNDYNTSGHYLGNNGLPQPNGSQFVDYIKQGINFATDKGLYVIIDWHTYGWDGNGQPNLEGSDISNDVSSFNDFFNQIMQHLFHNIEQNKYIIWEIFNEPQGSVSLWSASNYPKQQIKIIRDLEKHYNLDEHLIIIGTNNYSQLKQGGQLPDPGSDNTNICYTLHFYANTHSSSMIKSWGYEISEDGLNAVVSNNGRYYPIFISEWGPTAKDGKGFSHNYQSVFQDLDLIDTNSKRLKPTIPLMGWCIGGGDATDCNVISGNPNATSFSLSNNGQDVVNFIFGLDLPLATGSPITLIPKNFIIPILDID